jgi:hypothetical protein
MKRTTQRLNSWSRRAGIAASFALIGFFALHATSAATFVVAPEAESGASTGNVGSSDPLGASGGAAVKFGSPSDSGPVGFEIGVNGYDSTDAIDRVASVNGKVVRVEFTADASNKANLQRDVDEGVAKGVRIQPLVGWNNGSPAPDLTFLADWASTFGPGGTYWTGKPNPLPITEFELGNENSYFYKSGDVTGSGYTNLATAYGQRAVAAARAVNAANSKVGVLVELADGDTKQPTWINAVLAAGGPDLIQLMHGPVMHLYGPQWQARLDAARGWLAAKGVTAPYWVTEWGISSNNGANLTDNFGYPTNMTYAQAGAELTKVMDAMAAQPTKIHELMIYQHSDYSTGDNNREHYFGILSDSGGPKGDYTTEAKAELAKHP